MSAPTTEKKPAAHKQNGAQTPKHDEDLHVTREQLLDLLNEDLRREYQAVIAYVVYSHVITVADHIKIAA